MSIEDNIDLDDLLDEEDKAAIEALTVADVEAIDGAILAQLSGRWQKTAMVILRAMDAYQDRYDEIPDIFYGQRILALCSAGLIEAAGDVCQFRFSEIRAKGDNVVPA